MPSNSLRYRDQDGLCQVDLKYPQKTFSITSNCPLLLTEALLLHIINTENHRIYSAWCRVGSVGDDTSSGSCSYHAIKIALNSVSKSIAVVLKAGVTVHCPHTFILPLRKLIWIRRVKLLKELLSRILQHKACGAYENRNRNRRQEPSSVVRFMSCHCDAAERPSEVACSATGLLHLNSYI